MRDLADDEREILLLHALSGFKHREIAELTKRPLSTILSKYHRALKKMRAALKEADIIKLNASLIGKMDQWFTR